MTPEQLEEVLERTVLGYHRAVAGMVAAGNDVVVDHVLRERTHLACPAAGRAFDRMRARLLPA